MDNNEKPSTYQIDNKDAKYYRNKCLNNVATRIRYVTKISNLIVSIRNTLNLYKCLQEYAYKSDEQIYSDFINSFDNFVECREKLLTQLENERTDLLATDFESMLKEMESKIRATENETNGTEIKN